MQSKDVPPQVDLVPNRIGDIGEGGRVELARELRGSGIEVGSVLRRGRLLAPADGPGSLEPHHPGGPGEGLAPQRSAGPPPAPSGHLGHHGAPGRRSDRYVLLWELGDGLVGRGVWGDRVRQQARGRVQCSAELIGLPRASVT
jgi:hypothetical protein